MQINVVDYIIVIILLLSAINGFQQGFFLSLGRMTSAILAIGLAIFYGNDFVIFLDSKFDVIGTLAEFINQKIPILSTHPSMLLSFIDRQEAIIEPSEQLARFMFGPIAFLTLFLISKFMFTLFFVSLNRITSRGFLGGINRTLGMLTIILQNLLILTVILGIAIPPLEFAAKIDIMGAVAVYNYLQNSLLVEYLVGVFENLKIITGKYA